ncbi:MAG: ABC transporter ATP-binding protein [Thermodesulfobacteriota bacterium]
MTDQRRLKKKFVLGLLSPYKKYIALLMVLSFFAAALDGISIGMLVPLLSGIQQIKNYSQLPEVLQSVIKIFSGYTIEKQILLSLILVVLALVLKNLVSAVYYYLTYWLTARLSENLRLRITETLMAVGIGFYNNKKTGELVENIIYNTILTEEMIRKTSEMINNVLSFILLLALLVIFSWKLTAVTIVLSAIIAFGVSIYIKKISFYGLKLIDSGRELTASLQENLTGIYVIKSFTKEKEQTLKLKAQIEKHAVNQLNLNFSTFMVHVVTEALGVIAIAVLFLIAIKGSDMDYRLVLTQMLPFIYILARIIPVIKQINQARGVVVSRLPALDAVYDLAKLDNKPVLRDGDKVYSGLKRGIRFESVTFSYGEGEKAALTDAGFYIPKGKTTAIVGKSGAGKSTIINLLLRFYDPQRGDIFIDDEPLRNLKVESYRRHIGIVSQDTFIFNDTVRNNIAFGLTGEPSDEIIVDAAKRAGADEFISGLQQGYDTILGERGIRLSGGERQRISIARAILKNPEILILDEATSSLDTRTEELIHQAITDLSRNRTVVIIAHRLSTIKNADQLIVLRDGRVSETGSETELMEKRGEYYELATSGK